MRTAAEGETQNWKAREMMGTELSLMSYRSDFPSMDEVDNASHEQLARWYRFLPCGDTPDQKKICDRIAERFKKLGGMTPALGKRIGY